MRLRSSQRGMVREFRDGGACLYDFSVNGAELKSAHRTWLDQKVVARLKGSTANKWRIYLDGSASRTGTEDYNYGLSELRLREVRGYLEERLHDISVEYKERPWGEWLATTAGEADEMEDSLFRAVLVTVQVLTQPPPPPPPHREPPKMWPNPKPSTKEFKAFKIRIVKGKSRSIGGPILRKIAGRLPVVLVSDDLTFAIDDIEEKLEAKYQYDGGGFGGVIGFNRDWSYGAGDRWSTFQAPRSFSINDFSGPAEWHVGGPTGASRNTLYFGKPAHWYSLSSRFHVPIQIGSVEGPFGLSLYESKGKLILIARGQDIRP
jgi:hypothetical protein